MTNTTTIERPIHLLAHDIVEEHRRLGLAPSDYLTAYLGPLLTIRHLDEKFGYDSAVGIAAYCLDALAGEIEWKGSTAERLTRELRDRVASIYGEDFDALC